MWTGHTQSVNLKLFHIFYTIHFQYTKDEKKNSLYIDHIRKGIWYMLHRNSCLKNKPTFKQNIQSRSFTITLFFATSGQNQDVSLAISLERTRQVFFLGAHAEHNEECKWNRNLDKNCFVYRPKTFLRISCKERKLSLQPAQWDHILLRVLVAARRREHLLYSDFFVCWYLFAKNYIGK